MINQILQYCICSYIILDGSGDLLLASCAQDAYIRLWRVAKDKATPSTSSGATSERIEDDGELKLTGNVFQVMDEQKSSHQYTVTLESVLMGKAKGQLHAYKTIYLS